MIIGKRLRIYYMAQVDVNLLNSSLRQLPESDAEIVQKIFVQSI